MLISVDLCSDTVTKPSPEMRKCMADAEVGDEQRGEDPTTRKLEEFAAEMLGHNSALFFPSATMANEVAIRLLCEPGNELLAAENCHLFLAEAGGPAIHSGVMAKPIPTASGVFTGEDVRSHFQWSKGPHYPITQMVSIENTTNMGGGVAWSMDELNSVLQVAKEFNLKTHLDGARLMNASIKMGVAPEKIAARFDTVTLCLSKGLGCPVGAILAFDKQHWNKVRRIKQLMGGALRQSGVLAAAGLFALKNNVNRLQVDHDNAAYFARELSTAIPHILVENDPPSTNMVFFRWTSSSRPAILFHERCMERGIRFSHVEPNRFRAVTHLDVTESDIQKAVSAVREVCTSI